MKRRKNGAAQSVAKIACMVFVVTALSACGLDRMTDKESVETEEEDFDGTVLSEDDDPGFSFVTEEKQRVFYTKEGNNPVLSCSYVYSLLDNYVLISTMLVHN